MYVVSYLTQWDRRKRIFFLDKRAKTPRVRSWERRSASRDRNIGGLQRATESTMKSTYKVSKHQAEQQLIFWLCMRNENGKQTSLKINLFFFFFHKFIMTQDRTQCEAEWEVIVFIGKKKSWNFLHVQILPVEVQHSAYAWFSVVDYLLPPLSVLHPYNYIWKPGQQKS